MSTMKTPGVYVVEKNAFPNSVVEVATAVPAFVGYTEKARNGNKSLTNKPWRISSMAEFQAYFGGPPAPTFELKPADDQGTADLTTAYGAYNLTQTAKFTLYYNMLLFYANGGGPCYVVSIGDYESEVKVEGFTDGITQLTKEQEPTLLVVPEAVNLDSDGCKSIQEAMLKHCGYDMRTCFAILDVYEGHREREAPEGDVVKNFRENIGSNFLDFGAAYYPWVNTTIIQDGDLNYQNLSDINPLKELLAKEAEQSGIPGFDDTVASLETIGADKLTAETQQAINTTHKILYQVSATYRDILKEIRFKLNTLPPSAAIAGTYTLVDSTKGVWKAPANLSLAAVNSPSTTVSHAQQEDLNVPLNGKAINAIRAFVGDGIKIWGARTLDGNSLDWRYINVRRTVIMLEESIKNAARAYVFDPNTANTWVSVRSMISSFLTGIWKRGGLAGSSPEDAYSVHVGLGETMTPEDVLEGIMRVTVLIAVVRPAEFIEISFQQQMQKS